jgi:hypothetical protein
VHDSLAIHSGIAFNLSKKIVPDSFYLLWNAQGTDVDAKIDNFSSIDPEPFNIPLRINAQVVFVIGHFSIFLQMNHLHRA